MKDIVSTKRVLFILLFAALVFFGKKINFSPLLGTQNQFFTLFQFFGPIAGAFLGPMYGVITVLGSELVDFLFVGKVFSVINLIRLTPMLFAAYYFGTKKRFTTTLVPFVAMTLFMLHPVGKQVWFYSLYWVIPIVIKLLPQKVSNNLLCKSLGSTLTAHAVGSTAFLYSFPTEPSLWIALLPVVAVERTLFTLGIAGSYKTMNRVLYVLINKFHWRIPANVLKRERMKVLS